MAANSKETKHSTLFPLKLCTLNLPKLDLYLLLIISLLRNMAFRHFVITPQVISHYRHIKHQSGSCNFPATTCQTNTFSAFWDKRACRWMTPGCDGWATAQQPLTHICSALPLHCRQVFQCQTHRIWEIKNLNSVLSLQTGILHLLFFFLCFV